MLFEGTNVHKTGISALSWNIYEQKINVLQSQLKTAGYRFL